MTRAREKAWAGLEDIFGEFRRRLSGGDSENLPDPAALMKFLWSGAAFFLTLYKYGFSEKAKKLMSKADYLNIDTFKGLWYVLDAQIQSAKEMFQRRVKGQYQVDPYGLDEEVFDFCRPFFQFLYKMYWRVEVSGIENVASSGPVLLVANHSGVLPWDGAMVNVAVWEEHPEPRHVRTLYHDWFQTLPFVSVFLARTGQVLACPENAERLLSEGRLVAVFPEGLKGVGKKFKHRYKLARFGRGGFVRNAIRTGAPIVPVSVVGGEEIHPNLVNIKVLAKALGFPYFPITPTFPWFGLLGVIPLPSKWYIHFAEPVDVSRYKPEDANDLLLVMNLTETVRGTVQKNISELRAKRKSVFW